MNIRCVAAAGLILCASTFFSGGSIRADWSTDFSDGDLPGTLFFGDDFDPGNPMPPAFTNVDFSTGEMQISSDLGSFAAGEFNTFAAWSKVTDIFSDVRLTGKISSLDGAISETAVSTIANNDVFIGVRSDGGNSYLLVIDFHDGQIDLVETVNNAPSVINFDDAAIPGFSPSNEYWMELTAVGTYLEGSFYDDLGNPPLVTITANDSTRTSGFSGVGAALNDDLDVSVITSMGAGFDDLSSTAVVLPTVSLPAGDNFVAAPIGALTYLPDSGQMGFVHRGAVPVGSESGVTFGAEYLIQQAGGTMSLEFFKMDVTSAGGIDVSVGVRAWEDSAGSSFEDSDFFSASVELYNGDTLIRTVTLFEAQGDSTGTGDTPGANDTLKMLDDGEFGLPTFFDESIATGDATSARVVFLAANDSASERFVISSISATALTPGDVNGDGLVDRADAAQLLRHLGVASGAALADGDLTGDGSVGLDDLAVLSNHLDAPAGSPTAVPEPASIWLLLAAAAAFGCTGRRR